MPFLLPLALLFRFWYWLKIDVPNCRLDILLNDGLWTGEMVEIYGVPGAGKTQVSVKVFKPDVIK